MSNNKLNPEVKDRVWVFLAKLLEWADTADEAILKRFPRQPHWSSTSKGFKLSVKASKKDLAKLAGLEESEVSSAIKHLEHRWRWLEPFGRTQGRTIREFFFLLPSRDPEEIKALFENQWNQLNADKSRLPLKSSTLQQMALDRLQREQRWLTISRLIAHQGVEKPLDYESFVAPFLVEAQAGKEISSSSMLEKRFRPIQRQHFSVDPLPFQRFLDQVFRDKQSKKSGGSRIAIIGEPGSGKTTLLQHTALWLANKLGYLPIWISLSQWYRNASNLSNLEAYILNDWLDVLMPDADAATQKLFRQMCIQGKVCLLIDGIDEVDIKNVNETAELDSQFKSSSLLSRMVIVVTCRADHWNNVRNVLQLEFDTYELLDLVDDRFPNLNRIDQFILKWFRSDPKLGRSLIQELNKRENLETKELMSNRLCLALLCHRWPTWRTQQGLPGSRMKLYERYVEDFFKWKPELVIPAPAQKRMKQALGALSYRALAQEPTPFQLSSRLVDQIWEERKLPVKWVERLQDVGILYPIQILDAGIDRTAYAFLHPIFQEYFAAQFIDRAELLFNPNYHNPQDPGANYYAIERKWQGVYFLWLSRNDGLDPKLDAKLDAEKDALIKNLISLEDTCGGFYYYRAYFLATAGLREFQRSRHATEILRQVVRWSFEQFDQLPTVGWLASRLIDEATKILQKTDSQRVVAVLKEFFWTSQSDPSCQCAIASRIGSFKQGKPFAVQELNQLLQSFDPFVRCDAAVALYHLAPKHPGLIDVLSALLDPTYDESIRLSAANLLKDDDSSHQTRAVETLHELSKNAEDDEIQELATSAIWALEDLSDLADPSTTDLHEEVGDNSAAPLLPNLNDVLEQLSYYRPESTQVKKTVKALFRLLFDTDSLVGIMVDQATAIQVIRVLKQQCIDWNDPNCSFEPLEAVVLLQRCAEVMPFSIFHEAWQSDDDTSLVNSTR